MKRFFYAIVFTIASATAVQAQEVVDTITVEVYGVPTAIDVVGPLRGYVGDTLTFAYEPVDADGNPTVAVVTPSVQDTTRAQIVFEGEDFIQVLLLRPGRLTLVFNVDRFDRLAIGGVYGPGSGAREGDFQWGSEGPFQLPCVYGGEDWPPPEQHACSNQAVVFMCAVGYAGDIPVFASNESCAYEAGLVAAGDVQGIDRQWLAMIYMDRVKYAPISAFKNSGYGPLGIPSSVRVG